MKRLLALLVVLAVLGICAPSFGSYILIYKAIISGKALNLDENTLSGGKLKAFLVVDIDDSEEPDYFAEIDNAALVLYDRVPGPKFYAVLNTGEGGGLGVDLILSPEPGNEELAAIELYDPGEDWWAILTGKLKTVNVGLVGKEMAPTSLSGRIVIDGSFFDLADIVGSADITATLNKSLTKMANEAEASVAEVVEGTGGIVDMLEAKGFSNID